MVVPKLAARGADNKEARTGEPRLELGPRHGADHGSALSRRPPNKPATISDANNMRRPSSELSGYGELARR